MASKKKVEKKKLQNGNKQNSTNKPTYNIGGKKDSKQNLKPETSNKGKAENSKNNKKGKCKTVESTIISNKSEISENLQNDKKENTQNKQKTNQDKSTNNKKIEENRINSLRKTGNATPESKFTKPPSLMNIGANCYLNSALQGISSCDVFLEELSELHKKYVELEKLSLFHKLIDILNGGKCNNLEISRNPIFRNWNKPGQQDSFELLAYVMNQVYNEIRKHLENKGKIQKQNMQEWVKEELPMRIIIEYEIKCACKNDVQVPLQSDLALHVAIPTENSSDLQTLVEQFFNVDNIEDYKCDTKGCDGEGAKRFIHLLRPLPKTLCIHLQRTYWNGRKMQKIDTYIKFPKILKIDSKFIHSEFQQNSINNQNFSENYNIASVIVHYGSVYGGHYVCYKKMNGKWFLTNDSSIKEVSENEVLRCKAYILFYEKDRADFHIEFIDL